MARPALFSASEAGWQTAQSEGTNMHGDGDGMASSGVGERTLGAEANRFAELYGLTSDAEPLLMVSRLTPMTLNAETLSEASTLRLVSS